MNAKQRFLSIMHYENVDRLPFWDLEGITEQAKRQWCIQGMPIGVDVDEYVGFDSNVLVPLATTPIPSYISRTVAADNDWVTYIDPYGFTVKRSREQAVSPTVYYYVAGSMESMADWPSVKRRYNPTDIRRYPHTWGPKLFEHYRTLECPLGLRLHWGPGRGIKNGYMFGLEEFLLLLATEPEKLEPIFEHSVHFLIELTRELLENVQVNYVILMEDGMAYKNSALISPQLFRQLWYPHMRKLTEFFRSQGVDIICYYTSGNLEPLIPILLETGFNLFAPLECAADMEARDLRAKYGKEALLMGNIGRQALMDGPPAIDRAFDALLPLIESGGFIPVVDDMILPDISLESFMHYAQVIKSFRF